MDLDRDDVVVALPASSLGGGLVRSIPAVVDEGAAQGGDVADELLQLPGLLVEGRGADERGHEVPGCRRARGR